MLTIKDILNRLNTLAPTAIAYHWDNVGLMLGSPDWEVKKILLTLDVTDKAIKKAIEIKADLIISHHPFIFRAINCITNPVYIELIQKRIAVISMHTNLDIVDGGVNTALAETLGLSDWQALSHESGTDWLKFEVYLPEEDLDRVKKAVADSGGGKIGFYDSCSSSWQVESNFKPLHGSNPTLGTNDELSTVKEVKLEFMAESFLKATMMRVIHANHSYEEPVYTITKVENPIPTYSLGLIGKLAEPIDFRSFATFVKKQLNAPFVRLWYGNKSKESNVTTVAVCGGSGASVIGKAIGKADILVTADLTYHTILDSKLPLIDAGHLFTEYPVLKKLENYLSCDELEFEYLTLDEHEYTTLESI